MLSKLLKSRATAKPRASIPNGQRVYAIGDIHGCAALLEDLLGKIDADDHQRGAAETTLIFLGDLVDRGPESAQVIERLKELARHRPRVRFLTGNHEEIFLGAVEGEPKALRLFCRIGGRETAISYGIAADEYEKMDYEELARALATLVPRGHQRFVAGFEDMIAIGDYVFVHAGVRPDVALDAQKTRDLRWIREPFLDHRRALEKTVVHGHTISESIDVRTHRIGVDTGAYTSGKLSAIGLERDEYWTITTG